jgi:hypothetical protein
MMRGRPDRPSASGTGRPQWTWIEPQAWPTNVAERMISGRIKAHELERLLPWTWKTEQLTTAADT